MSSAISQGRTTPPPSQNPPYGASSSNGAPQEGVSTRKQRRNPSVTPRKFNRFFTPRSLASSDASSSRNALHEISGHANGQDPQSSPIQLPRAIFGRENTPAAFPRDLKRRKLYHTPESSPEYFEVDGKRQDIGFRLPQVESSEEHENIPSSPCERAFRDLRGIPEEISQEPLESIVQIEERGLGAQLLQQRINAAPTARRQYLSYPVNGWSLQLPNLSSN